MKKLAVVAIVMLLASSVSAAEVFDRYILSNVNNEAASKVIQACLVEDSLSFCGAARNIKKTINGLATYVEKRATNIAEEAVEHLGIEEPVAATLYLTKVVIDRKIVINRLKLPLINNDRGSLELSTSDVVWMVGWSF